MTARACSRRCHLRRERAHQRGRRWRRLVWLLAAFLAAPAFAGDVVERLQVPTRIASADGGVRYVASLRPMMPLFQIVPVGGGGGGTAIGGVITGGTDTRVLFDDAGVVGESAGFTYTKGTTLLTVTAIAVSGTATFSGGTNGAQVPANSYFSALTAPSGLYFGGSNGGRLASSSVATPDTLYFSTGNLASSIQIMEDSDSNFDFNNGPCGVTACTDPTLIVHSHNQATREFVALWNDGTNGWLRSGDAKAAVDTDTAGKNLNLAPGIGTSAGAGAQVSLKQNIMAATGTAAQVVSDGIVVCGSKTLSNTSATTTTLATIGAASNTAGGAVYDVAVQCDDGTNFDSEMISCAVAWVNKAGTFTITAAPVCTATTAVNNSGSCTVATTVTGAASLISLKVTPVIAVITPTTTKAFIKVRNSSSGAVACQ